MKRAICHTHPRPPGGSPFAVALALGLLAAVSSGQPIAESPTEREASFTNQIAPLLAQKCLTCHSQEKAKGGFRLHTFEALMTPGDSKAPPITPGKPGQSKLLELITAADDDDRMPQKDDPLPAEQIALLERWIRQGARFDGPQPAAPLTSFLPPIAHPDPPASYPRPVPILGLAFSPDGQELAASGYHEAIVWDPANGQLLRRFKNLPERIHSLAYAPDGKRIAIAGGSPGRVGEVKLFDAAQGPLLSTFLSTKDSVLVARFSPDGTRLATAGADNAIRVFEVETGQAETLIEQHADWVMDLAWAPDGAHLASASRDKTARVFNSRTGELESTYVGHSDLIFALAFHTNGQSLFSAGRERRIHLWEMKDAKKAGEIGGFDDEVLRLLIEGDEVFTCSADRLVRRHSAKDKRELLQKFEGHSDVVYGLAYHAPTRRLASGAFDGEVRVWDAQSGDLLISFKAAPGFREAAP